MRHLRRYVCTIDCKYDGPVINKYNITLTYDTYIFMRGIFMSVNIAGRSVRARYRKSYDKCKTDPVIPQCIICFDYPVVTMYNGTHRILIEVGDGVTSVNYMVQYDCYTL